MATKKKRTASRRTVRIKPAFGLCAVKKTGSKIDIRDCYTAKEAKGIILFRDEKFIRVRIEEC